MIARALAADPYKPLRAAGKIGWDGGMLHCSSCAITVRFLSEAPPGDKAAKLTVSRPGAPNIVACDLLGGSS